MCGRYTVRTTEQGPLAGRFGIGNASAVPREALDRHDVCPTEPVLAVIRGEDGSREARMLRWGLAPSWATLRGGRPLINARDDKLRTSGAWKGLVSDAASRCLVVADGWLEWNKPERPGAPKQRFLHELAGGEPFAFAGLWCVAKPRDAAEPVASCTIVTVAANREAAVLHDRMPAVLDGEDAEAAWLSGEVGLEDALALVRPLRDGLVSVSGLPLPVQSEPQPALF
jgi:putative SOS response-associated peptidase YedK